MSTPSIVELYSKSKCPRACGDCRHIDTPALLPRMKKRDFPYIRIIQDCNMGGEYLRYFLFEEKKGPKQVPVCVVGRYDMEKILWNDEHKDFYRPKDAQVYKVDDKVSYHCKVLGKYEWCLFLLPEEQEPVEEKEAKDNSDIVEEQ